MGNHITRFEVSNFKKFDRLVVADIGQVNLITGDNNVGKTSLLEVLLWEPDIKQILCSLSFAFLKRKIFAFSNKATFHINNAEENKVNNLIGLVQHNKDFDIDVLHNDENNISVGFFVKNLIVDMINNKEHPDWVSFINKSRLFDYKGINPLSKNWLLFYKNNEGFNNPKARNGQTYDLDYMVDVTSEYYFDFLRSRTYLPYMSITDLYGDDLMRFYDEVTKNSSQKEYLINTLNQIISSEQIKYIESKPIQGNLMLCIATEKMKDFHPITYYGDGFIRAVRIILEMLVNKNKRFMVDEIETGLHFSRQREFWEMIMKIAIENNVQLFCTTHSQDCIKAFVEAGESIENHRDKLRLIELEEAKSAASDRNVYASTYTFEQIKTGLESGINLRGGRLYG